MVKFKTFRLVTKNYIQLKNRKNKPKPKKVLHLILLKSKFLIFSCSCEVNLLKKINQLLTLY